MVIYPSPYIFPVQNIFYFISTFRLLNVLLISSTLAFKVGLFNDKLADQKPAVFAPLNP